VFVPSFTFMATAEAIALEGATPVFVDVLPGTFNMDPASLERAIGEAERHGLNPRMVIAVDLFGQPADYAAIGDIAARERMLVVADAAQSFGAKLGEARVGTLAAYTTTSFFPAKPLGCYGDGGAVFTEDPAKAEVLRSLRFHGKGRDKYDNVRIGLNSRLDTLQAAILAEKMTLFPLEIVARDAIARVYGLKLAAHIEVPQVADDRSSVWAQYTLKLPAGRDRAAFIASLKEEGVPTAVYYPTPLHRQTAYRGFPMDPEGCKVSDDLAARVLSVPMHPYLDEPTQDRVVAAVARALS
jgi:dTDP-4-amino-4,6-dideoxygalactose transaminase